MHTATTLSQIPGGPSIEAIRKRFTRTYPDKSFDRLAELPPDIVRAYADKIGGDTDAATGNVCETGASVVRQPSGVIADKKRTRSAGMSEEKGGLVRWAKNISRLDLVCYTETALLFQNATHILGPYGVIVAGMVAFTLIEVQSVVKDKQKDNSAETGLWAYGFVSAILTVLIHYPSFSAYFAPSATLLPVSVKITAGIVSAVLWFIPVAALIIMRQKTQDDFWHNRIYAN